MGRNFPLESAGFNPFGELIGLSFSRIGDGYAQCIVHITPRLLNPQGVVHGGVLYSMADTGMGAALYTLLEEGQACATVEVKIQYLKPVTSGALTCATRVIQKGRNLAFLESDIQNGERCVGKATGTFSIFLTQAGRERQAEVPEQGSRTKHGDST